MNVSITGKQIEITDALKSYIHGGLDKVRSHFDKVIDADIVLSVQKHNHIADVHLRANGIRIHSRESSKDMYSSVDTVMERIDRQVLKYKDRINRHQPRSSKEARSYTHGIFEIDDNATGAMEQVEHQLVHREQVEIKPMTVEEAIMQIELLQDRFLVYLNDETGQVNVMYARENGAYGVIEPQP